MIFVLSSKSRIGSALTENVEACGADRDPSGRRVLVLNCAGAMDAADDLAIAVGRPIYFRAMERFSAHAIRSSPAIPGGAWALLATAAFALEAVRRFVAAPRAGFLRAPIRFRGCAGAMIRRSGPRIVRRARTRRQVCCLATVRISARANLVSGARADDSAGPRVVR
jgi:hypothetical protein